MPNDVGNLNISFAIKTYGHVFVGSVAPALILFQTVSVREHDSTRFVGTLVGSGFTYA